MFKRPWPGVMRTVYGNHQRFESTYFKKFPGYYVTGDGEGGAVALAGKVLPPVLTLVIVVAQVAVETRMATTG